MHEDSKKILNLMFRPGETICVHHNKYAYHSVELEHAMSDRISMVSNNSNLPIENVSSDKMIFVALNPIKKYRNDENVYKYRNLLIEVDIGIRDSQINYIKNQLKIPYSAMIWSGSKSIHVLIALSDSFPTESSYRFIYKWILNISALSDQALGNPSRSIRLPGAIRPETGKEQELIELKDRISMDTLISWLNEYPSAKPKMRAKRDPHVFIGDPSIDKLKEWTKKCLTQGIDKSKGRNNQFFSISCDCALANFTIDGTIELIESRGIFHPERDFTRKELIATVKSAFRHIHNSRK